MVTEPRLLAQVQAPAVVFLPARGKRKLELDVLCQVHNTGEEDYGLVVEHPDDIHAWHLLDKDHREVQRAPAPRKSRSKGEGGVETHASQHVPGGHSFNFPHRIELDTRKLKAGQHYFLRYQFWGQVSEAEILVEADPSTGAKPKPRRKPKAARKPAKRGGRTAKS